MPLNPDERRARELSRSVLAALQRIHLDLSALVALFNPSAKRNSSTEDEKHATQDTKPDQTAIATVVTKPDSLPELVKEYKSQNTKDSGYNKKTLGVSVATLFTVSMAAGFTLLQWRTMDKTFNEVAKQTSIAKGSLESVQRAFINFRGVGYSAVSAGNNVKVPNFGTSGHGFQFWSTWENSGTTPAVNVLSYFVMDEIADDQTSAFKFLFKRGTPFRPTVMGPRATGNSGWVFEPQDFWKSTLQNKSIYFWGWKIYRDVFADTPPHVTEFCSNLVGVFRPMPPGSTAITANTPWSFQFGDCDGRHNCADQDCEDYNALMLLMETHQPAKR